MKLLLHKIVMTHILIQTLLYCAIPEGWPACTIHMQCPLLTLKLSLLV